MSTLQQRHSSARRLRAAAVAVGLAAAAISAALLFSAPAASSTQVCAYSALKISALKRFSRLVHRDIACAQVFNDTAPDWASWQKPWFLTPGKPDLAWAKWAKQGGNRRLIISQSLFPAQAKHDNWLEQGARGAYMPHAAALARNLVAAGLGSSVIRLAPEMNGDWNADSIPASKAGLARWREFWRRTVEAMRSVPRAHFQFDWCVNAGVKPVPLASFYPGDRFVDIVGVDAYDSAGGGWSRVFNEPDGIAAVARFARTHHKPLSIPEWGLMTGGPNDSGYVNGIARVVRRNRTAYQAYFFAHDPGRRLQHAPRAIAAYRRHFGQGGDSVR